MIRKLAIPAIALLLALCSSVPASALPAGNCQQRCNWYVVPVEPDCLELFPSSENYWICYGEIHRCDPSPGDPYRCESLWFGGCDEEFDASCVPSLWT
jgi:hypothetical protein